MAISFEEMQAELGKAETPPVVKPPAPKPAPLTLRRYSLAARLRR
jgi:hypothetical protein